MNDISAIVVELAKAYHPFDDVADSYFQFIAYEKQVFDDERLVHKFVEDYDALTVVALKEFQITFKNKYSSIVQRHYGVKLEDKKYK